MQRIILSSSSRLLNSVRINPLILGTTTRRIVDNKKVAENLNKKEECKNQQQYTGTNSKFWKKFQELTFSIKNMIIGNVAHGTGGGEKEQVVTETDVPKKKPDKPHETKN